MNCVPTCAMADERVETKHLQVFKLQGRRNRMEFIDGFPGVASAFKVKDLIYDGVARPHNGDDLEERQAIWDQRTCLRWRSYDTTYLTKFTWWLRKGTGN